MKMQWNILIYFLLLSTVIACTPAPSSKYQPQYSKLPAKKEQIIYIFGVHPLHNPKKLFEIYAPLIDYFNQKLSENHIPCTFKLEASRNYSSFNNKLFQQKFDFALPNPYQTVEAIEHGYKVFGKMGDDHNFKGIILTRKDSQIKTIQDLKNKIISYPAPTALAATMMPQWLLHKHGINVMKDLTNIYVGSQESSIMNVYFKKSDAAATWPLPWEIFVRERPEIAKDLVVKWSTFQLPNNALIVKKNIPKDTVNFISALILNLHNNDEGKKILKKINISKFERADEKTYKSVKIFLKNFDKEIRPIRN